MRFYIFIICLFCVLSDCGFAKGRSNKSKSNIKNKDIFRNNKEKLLFYKPLMKKLEGSEDRNNLVNIFLDKRVTFLKRLILLNLDQPSIFSYVKSFLKKKEINRGRVFLKQHKALLEKAEEIYDIPKEVIVAILYIETKFDLKTAKYLAFNAYSSLAYSNLDIYVQENLKILRKKYKKLPSRELKEKISKFRKRSVRKSEWALRQLKALFIVSKSINRPIIDLKGSFAGALGYPQFIPTSYLSYAVDGNCDYLIDLYNIDDAIFSIANYLYGRGFRNDDILKQKKAIYHYNNNDDYVYFILAYSKKL